MSPLWQTYWRTRLHALRPTFAWASLGIIPFLLFFTRYGWVGFFISMSYSLIAALTVWLTFGGLYGGVTWFQLHRNITLQPGWKAHSLANLLGTALGVYVASQFVAWWTNTPLSGHRFYQPALIGLGFTAFFTFYALYQEARTLTLEQQAALAEARYLALENQLQPHFLFNALNSLGELIETNQKNASQVAFTLADLYRQILANSKTRTATLASELAIARAYLELEKLRYGDRLHYVITSHISADTVYVPSLVLQTLVENAIKHGIAPALAGGVIEVEASKILQGYEITVSNTGTPLRPLASSPNVTSTGLANARQRLALLYGSAHSLTLTNEGERTVARFSFTGVRLD